MSKLKTGLYKATRKLGKVASVVNDIETIATGNPKKIFKRIKRKTIGKTINKVNQKIMRKIK